MSKPDLQPDYGAAIRFLQWLYPTGPWLLTAIPFDRQSPFPTRKFVSPDGISPPPTRDVMAWLLHHEQMNLYYSVNEPVAACSTKKAMKTDIARVHFLHVDMDVRKSDETEEDAQRRIENALERYAQRPSGLVASGGGFNALWRLHAPEQIEYESESKREAATDDVEARNRQIAADLEGDVTHDISRILRIPGTINRLNQTKVDRGREPSVSSIVWLNDLKYDLNSFMAAPTAPKNQTTSGAKVADVAQITEDVNQLHITDKLKLIISSGHDSSLSGPIDRSAMVWYVCCELVRLGFKDEVVLGIITDSRYRISDHVYAQGSRWKQYAIRQIRRAKEKAHDPKLLEMNDKYAVIKNYGGKCVVMIEEPGEKLVFVRPSEFFYGNDNEKIVWKSPKNPEKDVVMGVGTWWFDQRMRRQYERVVFEPGREVPDVLNLWQGFAVEPIPGREHERYLENMFVNICCSNQERYDYLLKWMARVVQRPATQAMVAPVLLGDRGTGKSVFGKGFARLFGAHAFVAKDAKEITGRFNEHLRSVVFLLAEEAFDIRDRSHESVLKELITSDVFSTEGKGFAIQQTKNYVHPMLLSNEEKVVPAGDMERRYCVYRVKEKTHANEWFRRIDEDDQREGSLSHLLHHLLSVDLTGFNVTDFPVTEELRAQQAHSLSREDDWLWSKLESGQWFSNQSVPWEGPVIKEALHKEYLQTMAALNVSRPLSLRQFGMWVKRALPNVWDKQLPPQRDRSRPWAFEFKSLTICREYFAKKRGQVGHEWPPIPSDDELALVPPEAFS